MDKPSDPSTSFVVTRKLKDLMKINTEELREIANESHINHIAEKLLDNYASQDAKLVHEMMQREARKMHTIHIRDKRVPRHGYPINGIAYKTLCGILVPHDYLSENQPDSPREDEIMDPEEPTCEGCILMQLDPEVRKNNG